MIITQMHLVLWTIKGHSKMFSFVTQHNPTDVSSWGSVQLACWLQESPPELLPHPTSNNVNFLCKRVITDESRLNWNYYFSEEANRFLKATLKVVIFSAGLRLLPAADKSSKTKSDILLNLRESSSSFIDREAEQQVSIFTKPRHPLRPGWKENGA